MHIIIDFDYTLFNTDALRQKLLHTLEPFSVKEIEYRFAERELKVKHLYNIDHHLNMLIHGTAREQAGKIVDDALNH
ncbi:MAG TPA: hypothetical protein VJB65_03425, partial [Patescibacteria group bacterium]|nr:hypothetical protein [Patescibacteria group bacterium]